MTTPEKQEVAPPSRTVVDAMTFIGGNLVPDKLLGILSKVFNEIPDAVWTTVFSPTMGPNDKKEAMFSVFYYSGKTIEVNVAHHFSNMVDRVSSDDCNMSPTAFIWYNLLVSCFHELWHGAQYLEDGIKQYDLPVTEQEAHCNSAQEWAMNTIHTLAKTVDIEPPTLEEWGDLGEKIAEFTHDCLEVASQETEEEAPWAHLQQTLAEANAIYVSNDKEITILTMREYCRLQLNDGDDAWEIELVTAIVPIIEEEQALPDAPVNKTAALPATPGPTDLSADCHLDDMPEFEDYESAYESDTEILPNTSPAAAAAKSVMNLSAPGPDGPGAPITNITGVGALDEPLVAPSMINRVETSANDVNAVNMPNMTASSHGLSQEDITRCSYYVYMRLAGHMMRKCQFQPGGDVDYANPFGVMDGVYIGDIPNAELVFDNMDCLAADGDMLHVVKIFEFDSRLPNRQPGFITGKTFLKNTLPGYCIYLNVGNKLIKRTILPQNCNKMNGDGTALSGWAQKAKRGHFIVLVYRDITAQEKAANTPGITVKIEAEPGSKAVYQASPIPFANARVLEYPPIR
ncbi:MAG: hypothetical protein KAV87_28780 [Desulfobacteraceae bacterium]|nr:hypothetical protein [Desulfobacteraceae bacterium]